MLLSCEMLIASLMPDLCTSVPQLDNSCTLVLFGLYCYQCVIVNVQFLALRSLQIVYCFSSPHRSMVAWEGVKCLSCITDAQAPLPNICLSFNMSAFVSGILFCFTNQRLVAFWNFFHVINSVSYPCMDLTRVKLCTALKPIKGYYYK